MTAAVEFELWSRQNWTNLDVVGEAYRLDEIRRLFPHQIGPNDRELVGVAHLRPEPTNPHDPNAVSVILDGVHVGYLPKELSPSYQPTLTALLGRGLAPSPHAGSGATSTRTSSSTSAAGSNGTYASMPRLASPSTNPTSSCP